jgi:hypothetical protein
MFLQGLLDALCTNADWLQIGIATARAGVWYALLIPAVMATQTPVF